MDRLIDEIVKVSVTDAIAAADATAVNTAAVLGISTKASVTTQVLYDQESVESAYNSPASGGDAAYVSELSKVTRSFFGQSGNPGKLVCIPVAAEPTVATIAATLDTALGMGKDANNRDVDFYHVVYRPGSSVTAANIIAMIEGDSTHKGIEEWCKENFRICHIEVTDRTKAESVLAGLAEPTTRVAIYFHNETSTEKSLAAALVAERCGKDPARGTWAHKTLDSVVADATTKANLVDAQNAGLNVYVKIAGVSRTYFGTMGDKTKFIDSVIKKDWLKFRTQEAIFDLLGSANSGDGVDFNDGGIQSVAAAMNKIGTTAMDNEHRYVLPDSYEVSVPLYKDISAADKAVRNLPKVKATFEIQESIHTVKTVELQVVA